MGNQNYKQMKRILLFISLLTLAQIANAQKQVPIVKANSKTVTVRDGKNVSNGNLGITTKANPFVYAYSGNKVTFITDADSITIQINSKIEKYDFVFLSSGKDSTWVQVKYPIPYEIKLKKAKKYNYSDSRFVPKFEYQSMDNPNLVRTRKDLKLDSIAGTGNELSKIFNLMHWVHNIIRHDGSSNNPTLRNAIELVKVCKTENRGVNCRMMATVLNECYLSLGIKSRYITCMPKETQFDDCHVINMVYSNDLKKWIWIDPTFDAYVMNEKGELLGIREVRERLINGKPLILNADANWNRMNSQTKEDYLEKYMAKNLYRLQTPLISEYDTETWKDGKEISYIELLPLDGIEQTPQKSEVKSANTNVKRIVYKTNNPDLFWEKSNQKQN